MGYSVEEKFNKLKTLLYSYPKVAVAFSGGVDSSLLLHTAGKILGKKKVLALHGVSCLSAERDIASARNIFYDHCSKIARYKAIDLHPLLWKEFVTNNENRCYYCKKRLYSLFKAELDQEGAGFLLDGTNLDDLKENRPGFKAILELSVDTPLLKAGLNKNDIRKLAKQVGLPNYNLPSNSCLATRIASNFPITSDQLTLIDEAEMYLHQLGFPGNRVRPSGDMVTITVQSGDIERLNTRETRIALLHHFQLIGFKDILLNLQERKKK